MKKVISKNASGNGPKIWEGVSRAANSSPAWIKPQIREAAQKSADRIYAKSDSKDQTR